MTTQATISDKRPRVAGATGCRTFRPADGPHQPGIVGSAIDDVVRSGLRGPQELPPDPVPLKRDRNVTREQLGAANRGCYRANADSRKCASRWKLCAASSPLR